MAKRKFELTKIDASDLKELDGWKVKMETLVEENPYIEVTDKESYDLARKRRTNLKSGRTEVQGQDKMIGTFLSNFRKKTKEIGETIVAIVQPHEVKQQQTITAWEEEVKREKNRKILEEEQRVERIKGEIDGLKDQLQTQIDLLTYENREESKVVFDDIIQGNEKGFEEFVVLWDDVIDLKVDEFNTKVDGVIENEKQRLENVKLNIESEINKRMVDAQNTIVLSDPTNVHDLGKRVDDIMQAEFDFGDQKDRFEKVCSEYADKVSDRIKVIHGDQVTEQRNRVISVREGLLDIVFQMTIEDYAEKTAYIKNALDQKMEDLLVPEEFEKMVDRVNAALKEKLEIIATQLKAEEERLSKRLEGRINILKERGFVKVKKNGMWHIDGVINPIGEDDLYDYTDPDFKEYVDAIDVELLNNGIRQKREERLKSDKGKMTKFVGQLPIALGTDVKFDNVESNELFAEIQADFKVWVKLKVELINKL